MKTATEYMLNGVQIAMTPLLRPQPGSGIHELITKGLTPIKQNTQNGKILKMVKFLNTHYIVYH